MDPLADLLGNTPGMVALREQVRGFLRRQASMRRPPPVLIEGETGSGKGLLARLMHKSGPRAGGPFVDINCAAIPETLLEAELFGYERGAFTDARQAKPGLFQTAHGGTLFLDEIGLLALGLQAKLLSVLDHATVRRLGGIRDEAVNVAIVAATNETLLAAVRAGRFREDLYHRLAVFTVELPPLRSRRDDIEVIARHALARTCADYQVPARELTADARAALRAHDWPGNVRELGNVIERAVLQSEGTAVTAEMLDLAERRGAVPAAPPAGGPREDLRRALEATGWNITRAAAMLGLTRNTVRARIERHGLRPEGPPAAARPPDADTVTVPEPAADAPSSVAPAVVSGVTWTRRRVTFLRARVAGDESPSPAAARALETFIEKAQSFGGRVEEVGPRRLLVVFGHEPAEDGPRRAANAALAILRALESPGCAIGLAIHVARVLVAPVAHRLEIDEAAKRDAAGIVDGMEPLTDRTVVVSDAAAEVLARHFTLAARADEGPGHRLLGLAPAVAGRSDAGFVGRQREIELLEAALDQARGGRGQVVTLAGDPGIGKSRLLWEFTQRLGGDGVTVLEGRCASYATHVPYFPVVELLAAVCGIQATDGPDAIDGQVLAALERLGESATQWAPYLQYLLHPRTRPALAGQSPDVIKSRTVEALRQLVVGQQARRPLVLAVEDLHWIDKASEEFLTSLAETVVGLRVLLVTTSRPGYPAPWIGRSHATQIALAPLSGADSRRLVEAVMGDVPSAGALVAAILARAEGNPLFLEELAFAVRAQPASRGEIPATIHDVLASRIERLGETDKRLLQAAAVIGRDVPLALLQEAGDLDADTVAAILGRLQSAEFLHPTSFGADAAYAFRHALTHEVAYDSLLEERRPALHARVAAAIEKLTPEARERRPDNLARHYTAAGRWPEAAAFWYQAGQLAMQRSAHLDAIASLTEALALMPRLPEGPERTQREISAQLALATSLAATRGYASAEVERTLSRVRGLADALGESAQVFLVRWSLWRFYFSRADLRIAEELTTQLLAIAERGDEAHVRVAADVGTGITWFYLGDLSRACRHFEQALARYDPALSAVYIRQYGQDLGPVAWGFLGWTRTMLGDVAGGTEAATAGLDLARGLRHPYSLTLALLLACEVGELSGDAAAVRPLGEELIALSREHSFTLFLAFGLSHAGWARAVSGEDHEGAGMMRQGAELFRQAGQRVGLAHRARLIESLIAIGELGEADAFVAQALDQAQETDERFYVADLHRLRGELLSRRGEPREAELAFREAVAVATGQGACVLALRAATALARVDPQARAALRAVVDRLPATARWHDLNVARTLLEDGS